jgi:hypothetical protein
MSVISTLFFDKVETQDLDRWIVPNECDDVRVLRKLRNNPQGVIWGCAVETVLE